MDGKKILGIITARGGSKSIPGKNMRILAGKPLIYWTIEASKKSHYINRIIVSSDDDNILEYSLKEEVEIIKRPEEYARDDSSSEETIRHALDELFKKETFII